MVSFFITPKLDGWRLCSFLWNEVNLAHFSTLNSLGKVERKCLKEYTDLLSVLLQRFDVCFHDFKVQEPQSQLFSTQFAVEIDNVAEELQMELVELQCDSSLKQNMQKWRFRISTHLFHEKGFRGYSLLLRCIVNFDEVKACLKSTLWKEVNIVKLTTNMRIQQHNFESSQRFSEYLLQIGDSKEATSEHGKIRLSHELCKICPTLNSLINHMYPDITSNIQNRKWLQERSILTSLNAKVVEINFTTQEKVPTAAGTHISVDKCLNNHKLSGMIFKFT